MLISASNITKYNGLKCIVDDVSFTINDDDKIAFIGINGTGKSTLLKIIAGYEDYKGTILRKKDLRISYLPQNPNFNPEFTVKEQVYDYLKHEAQDYQINTVLNKFGITNYNQKIKELSGGQQKRVALAITLLHPCDLLLLDEPTNHLDNEMIEYLEKFLIRFNKGIFMVTHDRYFLERVTNKIIELDRHKLYTYDAHYSTYLEQKQLREEAMLQSDHKRKQFLKKELEWVRAGVQARSTKSKDRLKRFEELSKKESVQSIGTVEISHFSSRLGKKTIELIDVSMSYQEPLFSPFSYHFKPYDRIGIIGKNGCGKSTLLNIIAKIKQPTFGEVIHGDTVKIGFFKQGHEDMDPKLRVIDYIQETAHMITTDEGQLTAKSMCEKFLFDTNMQYTTIERLSGGEKRRLYLLKVLMSAPNVLLLDEPTNDLDIATLQILEDYLDSFKGIIITVSHDRYFIDRICDHLFVFHDGMIEYQNKGYSEYKDSLKEEKKKQEKTVSIKRDRPRKIKLTYYETKELASLEEELPLIEEKIKEIDNQMNDLVDYLQIKELTDKREELLLSRDEKEERLLELMEKQEQG